MTLCANPGGEGASRNESTPPDIMGDDRVLLAWHRTHLANERTFLAWCRTSITLIAFGFVVERLESWRIAHSQTGFATETAVAANHVTVYLALLSFLLAAGAIIISGFRFLRTKRRIDEGAAYFSVLPDILVVVAVVIVVFLAIALSVPWVHTVYWF